MYKNKKVVISTSKPNCEPVDFWRVPAVIALNNFIHKSLSNWACNIAIGCSHACGFCSVPSTSTRKQGPHLREYGVQDPDADWGEYVLLRPWDEKKYMTSLRKAEETPVSELKPDGNRAVIFCSTTDAYQTMRASTPAKTKLLNESSAALVRNALTAIRDHSTLNVRILTRSPLAKRDFDLFKSFGNRLVFGMSLPTLDNKLAKIYEPKAPAPSQRLETLRAAKAAGLNVYVAMAPTYPECNEADLRRTLIAIKEIDPITTFVEPINIRAENVARIAAHAKEVGMKLNTGVFDTPETWRSYSLGQLHLVERLSTELGMLEHLHLWPDKSLGSKAACSCQSDPVRYQEWLNRYWNRISEWPGKDQSTAVRGSVNAIGR